jgi:hypothetical protein
MQGHFTSQFAQDQESEPLVITTFGQLTEERKVVMLKNNIHQQLWTGETISTVGLSCELT